MPILAKLRPSERHGLAYIPDRVGEARFGEYRGLLSPAPGLRAYLFITALGVCGFVGFLVSSSYIPALATPLRILALVWFIVLGVTRAVLVKGR